MEEVKLFGAWESAYVDRVIWALEVKGVKYEYIEEDLKNKSEELLKYNPIQKKVPVVVHNGKPILESVVILEYIEETWPQVSPLLPKDPYERASARFWIQFITQKEKHFGAFYFSDGEEKEKTAKEVREVLRIIEDQAFGNDDEKTFFGGDEIGMVDLAMGFIANSLGVIEELVNLRVLDPNEFPRICKWVKDFRQHPAIKKNLRDTAQMFEYFREKRDTYIAAKTGTT